MLSLLLKLSIPALLLVHSGFARSVLDQCSHDDGVITLPEYGSTLLQAEPLNKRLTMTAARFERQPLPDSGANKSLQAPKTTHDEIEKKFQKEAKLEAKREEQFQAEVKKEVRKEERFRKEVDDRLRGFMKQFAHHLHNSTSWSFRKFFFQWCPSPLARLIRRTDKVLVLRVPWYKNNRELFLVVTFALVLPMLLIWIIMLCPGIHVHYHMDAPWRPGNWAGHYAPTPTRPAQS